MQFIKLKILAILLVFLMCFSCTGSDPDFQPDEIALFAYFVLLMSQSSTCEGINGQTIRLTEGVTSQAFADDARCLIVTTTGPATIQVTTTGSFLAAIQPFNSILVEVVADDPILTLSSGVSDFKFRISSLSGARPYTILVN